MRSKESSVTKNVYEECLVKKEIELNLEDALDMAGAGKYQVFHCALMLATLASAILEMIGNAFILPAATCDLDLPDSLRGIITSIPNIGVILTAPMWGHAADKFGRKPTLLISSLMSGTIGLAASCMPDLTTYAICKFAGSLFLACPSSLGFAYVGEMVPRRKRDFALLTVNGFLAVSSIFSPVLAWIILPHGYQISTITLKPWRLLTAAYAIPLILSSLWMTQAMESPKFLMSKGRNHEALAVLKHIFMKNKAFPDKKYCVTSLKPYSEEARNESKEDGSESLKKQSMFSLMRPPHLKWLALTGFLMFGLFSLLNGLFMFATDTINKALRGNITDDGTVCILMNQKERDHNSTSSCVDEISNDTFLIMVVTTLLYGAAVLVISLCPLSKRFLLVSMYTTCGVACLLSGLLTDRFIAGVAMSALQITALGVGPLTAYAVHLFPTNLRGTAVGMVLMCGRLGSVLGANAAGYFLSVACTATFFGFTILIFSCALLSFMLPKDEVFKQDAGQHKEKNYENDQVNR